MRLAVVVVECNPIRGFRSPFWSPACRYEKGQEPLSGSDISSLIDGLVNMFYPAQFFPNKALDCLAKMRALADLDAQQYDALRKLVAQSLTRLPNVISLHSKVVLVPKSTATTRASSWSLPREPFVPHRNEVSSCRLRRCSSAVFRLY